jgi:hypothetical protein
MGLVGRWLPSSVIWSLNLSDDCDSSRGVYA